MMEGIFQISKFDLFIYIYIYIKLFIYILRTFKLDTLHKIIGENNTDPKNNTDPDPSFVLTADNVKKILAIDMRFR